MVTTTHNIFKDVYMNKIYWIKKGINNAALEICVEQWEEENNVHLTYTKWVEITNHNLTKKPIKKLNRW